MNLQKIIEFLKIRSSVEESSMVTTNQSSAMMKTSSKMTTGQSNTTMKTSQMRSTTDQTSAKKRGSVADPMRISAMNSGRMVDGRGKRGDRSRVLNAHVGQQS